MHLALFNRNNGVPESDAWFLAKRRGESGRLSWKRVGRNESRCRISCKNCAICKNYAGWRSISEQTGYHRPNRAAKNTQGRNGLGNGQEGQVIRQGATWISSSKTTSSAITTSAAMHQKTYVLAATEEEEVLHRRRLTRNQILANQLQLSTLRRKKMS